jgi:putative oxidoreductase
MWLGGIALVPGVFSGAASLGILFSMAYAIVLEISKGFPFIAPDPFQIPKGDYVGPMGVGDPPSWEKALLYVVMALVLITCGGGAYSIDISILKPLLINLGN